MNEPRDDFNFWLLNKAFEDVTLNSGKEGGKK